MAETLTRGWSWCRYLTLRRQEFAASRLCQFSIDFKMSNWALTLLAMGPSGTSARNRW
jgi:hypothetical protein